jgi:hypothetical protein
MALRQIAQLRQKTPLPARLREIRTVFYVSLLSRWGLEIGDPEPRMIQMLDLLCRPGFRRGRVVQVAIDYALVVALVALIAVTVVPGLIAVSGSGLAAS